MAEYKKGNNKKLGDIYIKQNKVSGNYATRPMIAAELDAFKAQLTPGCMIVLKVYYSGEDRYGYLKVIDSDAVAQYGKTHVKESIPTPVKESAGL